MASRMEAPASAQYAFRLMTVFIKSRAREFSRMILPLRDLIVFETIQKYRPLPFHYLFELRLFRFAQ